MRVLFEAKTTHQIIFFLKIYWFCLTINIL